MLPLDLFPKDRDIQLSQDHPQLLPVFLHHFHQVLRLSRPHCRSHKVNL